MNKSKDKKTIKFSVLLCLSEVIFIVLLITIIAIFAVNQFASIIKKSVSTGAERTTKQISLSMDNYINAITDVMNVVKDELGESEENIDLNVKNILKLNKAISAVMIYDNNKTIKKVWSAELETGWKTSNHSDYWDFTNEESYYFSPPHVQNCFIGKYPWVITSVIKVNNTTFGDIYFSVDIYFDDIAKRIDGVGIGDHGYCYIIDSNGENVYHPQQQLFATKIKEEEPLITTNSGTTFEKDKIYVVMPIENIPWRLVGVGLLGELTEEYKKSTISTMIIICSITLVVAVIAVFLIAKQLSKPVEQLVREIKKFERNVLKYNLSYDKKSSIREMERLQTTFCKMVPMVQNLIVKVKTEQEELRKSQLKALQNQINPHFLYNTLDSILWMCEMKKNEEAAEMISALAKLFRISISKGKEIILLSKELESAESYLKIQSVRYNHKFTYKFNVDDEVLGCRCNKTVLQPFLENALSHGYVEGEDFEIVISGRKEENNVVISIKDNGMGIPENKLEDVRNGKYATGSGIGIGNVDKRIKMCFGEQYGVRIESEEDVGTEIFLTFPYQKEEIKNEN